MDKKLLIFASGTKDGGGSGFEKLCQLTREGGLYVDIVGVVSNHFNGGVRAKAKKYDIPFIYYEKSWGSENDYQKIVYATGAEFVALSGWLKLVKGLDPKTTFNIHPGPLPEFGGPGLYGHYVHEAVIKAFRAGTLTHSAVTMHFVTEEYDKGPKIFEYKVPIKPEYSVDDLAHAVNKVEHEWQWLITQRVLDGEITWDGKDPKTVKGALFY